MSDSCKGCQSYELKQMLISGQPMYYSGPIPCQTCVRLKIIEDNFTPIKCEKNTTFEETTSWPPLN